jgi:hypothetical protein
MRRVKCDSNKRGYAGAAYGPTRIPCILDLTETNGDVMPEDQGRPIVAVHECYSDGEAEVVAGVLRGEGIEPIVHSDPPHSVLPVTAGRFGRVRVYVEEDVAERARELLALHRTDGGDS